LAESQPESGDVVEEAVPTPEPEEEKAPDPMAEALAKLKEVKPPGDFVENGELIWFPIISNGSIMAGYCERSRPKEVAEPTDPETPVVEEGLLMKFAQLTAAINGVFCVERIIRPFLSQVIPESIKRIKYSITYSGQDYVFVSRQHLSYVIAIIFGYCYSNYNHWVLVNIFLICVAINAIECAHLSCLMDGGKLMALGLVAEHLDKIGLGMFKSAVKVKLWLPLGTPLIEIDEAGVELEKYVPFLGMADIVMPGLLLAFLFRYDRTFRTSFFRTALVGYLVAVSMSLSMQLTDVNFHLRHLINPCLLLIVLAKSVISGQFNQLVNYKDCYGVVEKLE
jgi:hypothetical protein